MDYFEYIDDYMNGDLDGDRLRDFENAMAQNNALKSAVENYHFAKKLAGGLIEYEGEEILDKIKEEPNRHFKLKWTKLLGIAAAMLLLVGMIWYLDLFKGEQISNAQFASNYFIEYGNTVRSGEVPTDSFERAKYFYGLNDFDSRDPIFALLNNEEAKIYLAFSAFKKSDYEEVLSIIADYGIQDDKPIQYLKALTLIMLTRENEATPILDNLSVGEDQYGRNAATLLDKIRK
jgi:hypothetical protein